MAVRPFLEDVIGALRATGCARGKVTFDGSTVASVEVEFAEAPMPVAVSPFRDKDGKPLDMDEGAGPLTKDPDDAPAAPVEEPSDAALERANFRPKKAT